LALHVLSRLPFIRLIGVVIILLSGDIIPWLLDFFFNGSPAICVGEEGNLPGVDIPVGGENPHPAPLVLPDGLPVIDAPLTPPGVGSPIIEAPVTPENEVPVELQVTPGNEAPVELQVTPENEASVELFVTPEDPSPKPKTYSWGFNPIYRKPPDGV